MRVRAASDRGTTNASSRCPSPLLGTAPICRLHSSGCPASAVKAKKGKKAKGKTGSGNSNGNSGSNGNYGDGHSGNGAGNDGQGYGTGGASPSSPSSSTAASPGSHNPYTGPLNCGAVSQHCFCAMLITETIYTRLASFAPTLIPGSALRPARTACAPSPAPKGRVFARTEELTVSDNDLPAFESPPTPRARHRLCLSPHPP